MYCPHCGKGEQSPDAYCRGCGEFLPDYAGKTYLLKKLLGGVKPETQVSVSLAISLITAAVSLLLLVFLNGYFDAQQTRTGDPTPPVVYFAYAFLASVAAWQLLSFAIGLRLKSKLGGRRRSEGHVEPAGERGGLPEGGGQALPPADFENMTPSSVTEEKTRPLERVPRGTKS
ncbi:MAG: hypothetical protein ABW250_21065 [Pyrinomonadaceae bacterium]